MGRVGEENGVSVVRLCKEYIDLADSDAIDQLCEQVTHTPGCAIHGSLECRPWSQWQRLNKKKHPRLCAAITADQQESERMLQSFIKVADIILDQGV